MEVLLSAVLLSTVLVSAVLLTMVQLSGGKLSGGDGVHIALFRGQGATSEAVEPKGSGHNLKGQPGEGYYMQLSMGTPPQNVSVLVDTGSSNFAVAAAPHKDITNFFNTSKSETFKDLGTPVIVPYTQGNWKGSLGRDLVAMKSVSSEGVEVNVAAITSSQNFFINGSHWEGILGLAFKDIARPDSSVEPFMDTFVRETNVTDIFSLQLCGTVNQGGHVDVSKGGTMVVGEIDKTLYTGDIYYAAQRRRWYYEVVMTDLAVQGHSLGLDCKEYNFDKTIVDSGTTNLRLPNTVFKRLTQAIKSYVYIPNHPVPGGFWRGEDMLCWPTGGSPWKEFPRLTLSLMSSENSTIQLTVSAQQYLRQIDGQVDNILNGKSECYKYAVSSSDSGSVIGAVVMEGFYVIFDRQNNRVGFAKSVCKNSGQATVEGPFPYKGNATACGYNRPGATPSTLMVVAYVMVGLCALCFLPVLFMILHWQLNRCRRPQGSSSANDLGGLLQEDNR